MPPSKLKVLVVDDVPQICDLYDLLLRRIRGMDLDVTLLTRSDEALARVRSGDYDLVVSDFRMNEMDGIEVLTAARERNPRGRRLLMTGYNEVPTSIDRIRAASIDAYVQKPLKAKELLILISDMLAGDAKTIETYRAHARELETAAMNEEPRAGMA